ncbi:MAG: shikimate kinase [Candidatus Acidiferrales bacterium]|jgi:shikimate kinase
MTSLPGSGGAPRRRLVALAGFMGSGKTTIGSLLARQLGWRFADLDTLIERAAGHAITEIFERHGEAAFREVEREQLLAALGRAAEFAQPTVLALGGGTIAQTGNLELLRAAGAAVVWLDCPLERLIARCALVTTRPLFRDEASFRALYEQRLPYYQQADYRVEAVGNPRAVVERILALEIFAADRSKDTLK